MKDIKTKNETNDGSTKKRGNSPSIKGNVLTKMKKVYIRKGSYRIENRRSKNPAKRF